MKIKGSKILVTGGAGFIGSHIAESLVKLGAKVTIIDNLAFGSLENLKGIESDIEFIKGDILDKELLGKVIKGKDIISHQAAQLEIFLATSNPYWDLEVNTIGSLNIFEEAKKSGVVKVINASSACVYGQKSGLNKEDDSRHPNWAYGVSKLAAEEYAKIYNDYKVLPVISLRYGIVYGEREWIRRALSLFLKRVILGDAPVVFGDGSQIRDFVYVGDVVRAHNKCIENDDVNGEVFNVGSGIGISIKDLAQKVTKLFLEGKGQVIFEDIPEGTESKIMQGKKRNAAELKSMLVDISRAKEKLNWQPEISLEDGLQREYNWAKENKHRWQNIIYTDRK